MADKKQLGLIFGVIIVFLAVLFFLPMALFYLSDDVQLAPQWNPSKGKVGENVVPNILDCPRTLYTTGDAYPGYDRNNPEWVWFLTNLHDSYNPTDILQPNLITGPVLGVANAFEGNDLSDEHLLRATTWGERLGWSLPNDYRRVFYTGTKDYDSGWHTWPKAKVTTKYLDAFDTTRARNVPQALRQYLKTNAKVVEISTENAENIPSLFASSQMKHTPSYIVGFGSNWTDENNYWYYYLAVSDVLPDHSIDISFNKACSENGQWCGGLLETRNVPLRTETVFESPDGDTMKIYNFLNNYYENEEEQWRESAVVYRYEFERTTITPTFKIYLQPMMQNSRKVFLPFYIDYDTGELVYIRNVNNQSRAHDYYSLIHDYFYYEPQIIAKYPAEFEGDFAVNYQIDTRYWPDLRERKYSENLIARFGVDIGNQSLEIISLGNEINAAESDEFIYFYNSLDNRLGEIQLGLKEGKYKTSNGVDVEEPALNSETEDKTVYYLPPFMDSAMLNLFDPHGSGGIGTPIPLGRNAFTDNWEENNYYIGDGFPWELDYRYKTDRYGQYYNYLNLQKGLINFDNKQFNIHESLVFGTDTPRVETSLTKGDDSYQDVAYVEIDKAGFKYIYAFDDPIDLQRASEDNPLKITFLGQCLKIVGTPSYNQIITVPCNCAPAKHLECRRNMCVQVDGPGDDTCRTNNDCYWPPPPGGSKCINDSGGPMCFYDIGIRGFECHTDEYCIKCWPDLCEA